MLPTLPIGYVNGNPNLSPIAGTKVYTKYPRPVPLVSDIAVKLKNTVEFAGIVTPTISVSPEYAELNVIAEITDSVIA